MNGAPPPAFASAESLSAADAPMLQVENLVRRYRLPRSTLFQAPPTITALDGVSLSMRAGRSLGVVGESGSGKSTLARAVMALETPTAGSVRLFGRDPYALPARELRALRRHFQMVFQDPYGSLDPRQTVARIVAEPLSALAEGGDGDEGRDPGGVGGRAQRRERIAQALAAVGLRAADLDKYPHEFSGGQRQRIAIARALVTRPRLIVADEPVSALDVSVQAHVLNLLQDLQAEHGVTYLLISHDLAVVDHVCDEVAVILMGRIVERGSPSQLFNQAAHPYTRALLDAVPRIDRVGAARRRAQIGSNATEPLPASPVGCPYAPRCGWRRPACDDASPVLREVAPGQYAACVLAETVAGTARRG